MCKVCSELKRQEPVLFPGTNLISHRWAWHFQDTHGIPMEFLPMVIGIAEGWDNWDKMGWEVGTKLEPPQEVKRYGKLQTSI